MRWVITSSGDQVFNICMRKALASMRTFSASSQADLSSSGVMRSGLA